MIRRVDFFLPYYSQYDVLHHFTIKLYEAFLRLGVDCRLLTAEKYNPRPFLTQLFDNPPDCTLSFNGLLPDEEDRFLCDMVQMPHVCCLVDSPTLFFPLVKSQYNIITCVDRNASAFFKSLQHANTLFMPHAVERNLHNATQEKIYDVALLASCLDYNAIAEEWKKKYPKVLSDGLLEAAERTLADEEAFYINTFVEAFDNFLKSSSQMNIEALDMISILDQYEMYIRGYDRVRLVQSIKDVRIDIFGQSKEMWQRYLGKNNNCTFHEKVPFEEALKVMSQSKILLNSCAWIRAGGHERIYSGMASGAVLVASENSFMKETFRDGENILFYKGETLKNLDHKISQLLNDSAKREEIASKGRNTVLHHHTWDHRAAALLKELSPIIHGLSASSAR